MSVRSAGDWRQRGSALVIVLLSLALLFSLGVPYLMVTRMREESAAEAYGRAQARVAVTSAAATFAAQQEGTHPSQDPTPLHDAPSEWDGSTFAVLPQSLGGGWEESTESWGAEIEAAQARVALGSAPPLLLQNLVHPCFLTQDVTFRDDEAVVTSTEGFPDQGLALIGGTWFEYAGKRERLHRPGRGRRAAGRPRPDALPRGPHGDGFARVGDGARASAQWRAPLARVPGRRARPRH
jgi:hypothetical protein